MTFAKVAEGGCACLKRSLDAAVALQHLNGDFQRVTLIILNTS